MVGIQGFISGSGHLVIPGHVARSIGWPESPFQWEVGLASICYGVLGVFAAGFGPDWWLAAIVAFAIFYLGAAAGHVREMVARHNFAPGNAGPMFFFDVVTPLLLAGLGLLTRPALSAGV